MISLLVLLVHTLPANAGFYFLYISFIHSMFIKSLIAATLAAGSLFVASPEAQARECWRGHGYTMCAELTAKNGSYNRWNVAVQNAYTTEYMDVTCYGKSMDSWRSRGGFNQSEAAYLANYFCSL